MSRNSRLRKNECFKRLNTAAKLFTLGIHLNRIISVNLIGNAPDGCECIIICPAIPGDNEDDDCDSTLVD